MAKLTAQEKLLHNKARYRIHYLYRVKKTIPHPASLPCTDCGGPADSYDHHLGYAPEHWEDVVPVCRPCHGARSRLRGEHAENGMGPDPTLIGPRTKFGGFLSESAYKAKEGHIIRAEGCKARFNPAYIGPRNARGDFFSARARSAMRRARLRIGL